MKYLLVVSCLVFLLLEGCDTAFHEPVALEPALVATNQMLVEGHITIKKVVAPEDGWVVVYRLGEQRTRMGVAPVHQGINQKVAVPYPEELGAYDAVLCEVMLFLDRGKRGVFEEEVDPPVQVKGSPLLARFFIFQGGKKGDAWIIVEDQEVQNHTVIIDEIGVKEPSDVVIHRDAGNKPKVPGIIGKTPLEPGVHTNVAVSIYPEEPLSCGERLWPMLHVRTVSDDQPFDTDKPIITRSFVVLCTD